MSSIRACHGVWQAAVLAVGVFGCIAAEAALGEGSDSIQRDQMRMAAGIRRQATALRYQVHTLSTADGSSIHEYLTPGGRVFAVTWHTRFKPDFEKLLGVHHLTYVGLAREAAAARPGIQRHLNLRRGDLVVRSQGFLNTFFGSAYLQSLLPEGVTPDEIR
jgi:hypothetical protein